MLQQGSLFDNRYVLTRFIGRGGFAEVWLVEDKLTGLEEALKIYAPGSGMDEDGLKLFVKEVSVVHDLRHSSLLTPKILGQCENQPYLVLPFCPNGSLNKKVGECTEEEAWKIMEQVASGLAYLHKRNIVHQDIKPDNILLDANNDCVITDFGISLKAQSSLRKSMRVQANSGTMAYMAPERFSAEPHPIPANDVWSLGAMMFELLEGNVPFIAQMGGLAQMNGAQIPTMHGDAGAELKQAILSMLNKDAAERPTAEQIVEIAKSKGAQAPKAAAKPKKTVKKEVSDDDAKKTQIIGNLNQSAAEEKPAAAPKPALEEKKTQIINTNPAPDTYHRPNRFEQPSNTPATASTQANKKEEQPKQKQYSNKWIWWLVIGIVSFIIGFIVVYVVLDNSNKESYYYDYYEPSYYDGSTSASQLEEAAAEEEEANYIYTEDNNFEFGYEGGEENGKWIYVYSNCGWYISIQTESWSHAERSGDYIKVWCDPNWGTSRSDWFTISSNDGSVTYTIHFTQH